MEIYENKEYNIKIYNCDIVELLNTIDNNTIDLILTDPPYGALKKHKIDLGHTIDWEHFSSECHRILTTDSIAILFGQLKNKQTFKYLNAFYNKFNGLYYEIIWDKLKISSPAGKYKKAHESIYIFRKGKGIHNIIKDKFFERVMLNFDRIDIKTIDKYFSSLDNFLKSPNKIQEYIKYLNGEIEWQKSSLNDDHNKLTSKSLKRFISDINVTTQGYFQHTIIRSKPHNSKKYHDDDFNISHPTVKPLDICEKFIKIHSNAHDLVFDPFLGSGTTAVACLNNNRKFIGCEIHKEYFDLAIKRIENEIAKNKYNLFEKQY